MPFSLPPDTLTGLASTIAPSSEVRADLRSRIDRRIRTRLHDVSMASVPPVFRVQVRSALLRRIAALPSEYVRRTSRQVVLSQERRNALKQALFLRLTTTRHVFVHTSLKWAAASAVFLLLVRFALPIAFITPPLEAETAVQIVPEGTVSLLIGGIPIVAHSPRVLAGPALITTVDAPATLLLRDYAVVRIAPHTTVRLHTLSPTPLPADAGPTLSVLGNGSLWALGIVSPILPSMGIETEFGTVEISRASVAIQQTDTRVTVSAYDQGIVFEGHGKKVGLSSGERVVSDAKRMHAIHSLPLSVFQTPLVKDNLAKDANYRREIASLQEERRQTLAGILPTSPFYSLKRLAEEVDVFFTLNSDVKAQKRVAFADTRFSEAATLLKEGDTDAAIIPLTEYRQALLDLATSSSDNIVKFLINQQIADSIASVDFASPDAAVTTLKQAVLTVVKDVPNTAALKPEDIQAYTLADELEAHYQRLLSNNDLQEFARHYNDLAPYIHATFSSTSVNPLLRKELLARLITVSSKISPSEIAAPEAPVLAMRNSIEQYLPSAREQREIQVTQAELDARVAEMVRRVLTFRMPRSRENEILLAIAELKNDPNRGTLLRRFAKALPQGLTLYVDAELTKLAEEMRQKET